MIKFLKTIYGYTLGLTFILYCYNIIKASILMKELKTFGFSESEIAEAMYEVNIDALNKALLEGLIFYPILSSFIAFIIFFIGSKFLINRYTFPVITRKTLKFFVVLWSIFTIVQLFELNTI